jgi:signal peptidase II
MGAAAPARRSSAEFLAVAAAVLAVDQSTKALALARLSSRAPVPLLGESVRLSLVHNTGSAFGLVQMGWLLVMVGVACCLLIPALVLLRRDLPRLHTVLLAAIWGGSIGNLLDRLRTGGVTDFIDLRIWPVFNVADIAITVGFAVLAVHLLLRR